MTQPRTITIVKPDGSVVYSRQDVSLDEEASRLEELGWRIRRKQEYSIIEVLGHRKTHVRLLAFGLQQEMFP